MSQTSWFEAGGPMGLAGPISALISESNKPFDLKGPGLGKWYPLEKEKEGAKYR